MLNEHKPKRSQKPSGRNARGNCIGSLTKPFFRRPKGTKVPWQRAEFCGDLPANEKVRVKLGRGLVRGQVVQAPPVLVVGTADGAPFVAEAP